MPVVGAFSRWPRRECVEVVEAPYPMEGVCDYEGQTNLIRDDFNPIKTFVEFIEADPEAMCLFRKVMGT